MRSHLPKGPKLIGVRMMRLARRIGFGKECARSHSFKVVAIFLGVSPSWSNNILHYVPGHTRSLKGPAGAHAANQRGDGQADPLQLPQRRVRSPYRTKSLPFLVGLLTCISGFVLTCSFLFYLSQPRVHLWIQLSIRYRG